MANVTSSITAYKKITLFLVVITAILYCWINYVYIKQRTKANKKPEFSLLSVSSLFRVGLDKRLEDHLTFQNLTLCFTVVSCFLLIITDVVFTFSYFTNSFAQFKINDSLKMFIVVGSPIITLMWVLTACFTVSYEAEKPHFVAAGLFFTLTVLQRFVFLTKGASVNPVSRHVGLRLTLSAIAFAYCLFYIVSSQTQKHNSSTVATSSVDLVSDENVHRTSVFSLCEIMLIGFLVWDRLDLMKYIQWFFDKSQLAKNFSETSVKKTWNVPTR